MVSQPNHSKYWHLHHMLWQFMDWIYPPKCGGCGISGSRWCVDCQNRVNKIDQNSICPLCGIPQSADELCSECAQFKPVYTAVRSWGRYEGRLRNAIHRLKYHNDIGISEELARPLQSLLIEQAWQLDIITAVPLNRKRLRERGYNQSALLARWVSLVTRIPFIPGVIIRNRDTATQVGLHAQQRHDNVTGAFTAIPEIARGRSIVIIDDVTTTGATLQACASALQSAGALTIYGLTLARAGQIHLS